MPVDIIRADNGQYSQLDGYIIVFLVMGKSVQCIDKQSEGDSVGYGTELIEFPVGTFFFSRQVLASQYQGCKPQRDIDGKLPVPRGDGKNAACHRRSGCSRYGHYHGIDPHASSYLISGIDGT